MLFPTNQFQSLKVVFYGTLKNEVCGYLHTDKTRFFLEQGAGAESSKAREFRGRLMEIIVFWVITNPISSACPALIWPNFSSLPIRGILQ